jgi:hypothetical protein
MTTQKTKNKEDEMKKDTKKQATEKAEEWRKHFSFPSEGRRCQCDKYRRHCYRNFPLHPRA